MHIKLCGLIILGAGHSAKPATTELFGVRLLAAGEQTAPEHACQGRDGQALVHKLHTVVL